LLQGGHILITVISITWQLNSAQKMPSHTSLSAAGYHA